MKNILILTTALVASTSAMAETPTKVKVYDHTKTIVREVPVKEQRCYDVKVPIYESVTTTGDAGGGALLGMILGGILGKGVTGDDGGAAAGAVIGGVIGADKNQSRTENREVGYRYEEECSTYTAIGREVIEVYSHSTIRFHVGGQRYVLDFKK